MPSNPEKLVEEYNLKRDSAVIPKIISNSFKELKLTEEEYRYSLFPRLETAEEIIDVYVFGMPPEATQTGYNLREEKKEKRKSTIIFPGMSRTISVPMREKIRSMSDPTPKSTSEGEGRSSFTLPRSLRLGGNGKR